MPCPRRQLGNFHLLERLHDGDRSEVYSGRYAMAGGVVQPVALKILRSTYACVGSELRSFLSEVAWATDLNHALFPRVVEAGEYEGHYYLATELIEGWTLAELLRSSATLLVPLKPEVVLTIVHEVALGLDHLHNLQRNNVAVRGVHLGVQLDNLMLRKSGHVVLVDFGGCTSCITQNAATQCQEAGGELSPSTDVHALGGVLQSMVELMAKGPIQNAVMRVADRARHANGDLRLRSMSSLDTMLLDLAREYRLELGPVHCQDFVRDIFGHSFASDRVVDPRMQQRRRPAPLRQPSQEEPTQGVVDTPSEVCEAATTGHGVFRPAGVAPRPRRTSTIRGMPQTIQTVVEPMAYHADLGSPQTEDGDPTEVGSLNSLQESRQRATDTATKKSGFHEAVTVLGGAPLFVRGK